MNIKTKRSIQWIQLNNRKYAGIHLIAEFWNGKNIENKTKIKEILLEASKTAGSNPLKITVHKFSPRGITGFVLLAESHISIHSWPEYNYLAIDLFTCGEKTKPFLALEYLKKQYQPQRVEIQKIIRGVFSE